jgi:hypothetical protein
MFSVKTICLTVVAITLGAVLSLPANAQTHWWSKPLGDAGFQAARGVAVDGTDVIVTGVFEGTVDFGGGPLSSGVGVGSMYLAKYDRDGVHLWSRVVISTDWTDPDAMAVDSDGSIVVTGFHWGSADFGGGLLTSAGDGDVFMAKYDTDGNYAWSYIYGDTLSDGGNGVSLDSAGHVFLTGSFVGSLNLGGPPLVASDAFDVFVAKFDAGGNHVWSRVDGGPQNELAHAITADAAGNVLATGSFILTADFGGGSITSAGGFDVYLAKYDPTGAHIWSRSYGGPFFDSPDGIVVDGAGDILLAGSFDTAIGVTMLAKLDPSGSLLWGKGPGSTAGAVGRSVDVDGNDNVLLVGAFMGDMSLGGDTLSTAGSSDIFLAKFDTSGGHVWSQQFVGGPPPGGDHASGVAADADGNVLATGWFQGTVDFGAGPVVSIAPGGDLFVAKYHGTIPSGVVTPPASAFSGLRNRPNPFNPSTDIEFSLQFDAPVTLSIYDVNGKRVRTLASRHFTRGPHSVPWDGRDAGGELVASGVYFLRLTAGNDSQVLKTVLVK